MTKKITIQTIDVSDKSNVPLFFRDVLENKQIFVPMVDSEYVEMRSLLPMAYDMFDEYPIDCVYMIICKNDYQTGCLFLVNETLKPMGAYTVIDHVTVLISDINRETVKSIGFLMEKEDG